MQQAFLVLAGVLVSIALVSASSPPGWDEAGLGKPALFRIPNEEPWHVTFHLAGAATSADGDVRPLTLRAEGVVLRSVADTDGLPTQDGELQGWVRLAEATGHAPVELPVRVAFHASRADYVAGVLQGWGFTLHIEGDGLEGQLLGAIGAMQAQHGSGAGLASAEGAASLGSPGWGVGLQGSYQEERV